MILIRLIIEYKRHKFVFRKFHLGLFVNFKFELFTVTRGITMRFYQSPAKIGIDHRIKLNGKTFPRVLKSQYGLFFQQILQI